MRSDKQRQTGHKTAIAYTRTKHLPDSRSKLQSSGREVGNRRSQRLRSVTGRERKRSQKAMLLIALDYDGTRGDRVSISSRGAEGSPARAADHRQVKSRLLFPAKSVLKGYLQSVQRSRHPGKHTPPGTGGLIPAGTP